MGYENHQLSRVDTQFGGSSSSKKRQREKRLKDHEGDDQEVKEMWDILAGGDPADDNNGVKAPMTTMVSEEDVVAEFFNLGNKKKKTETDAAAIALLVERVMAELEVAAEDDIEFNQHSKPAINKLMKLPLLTDMLTKQQLQREFLDRGVLTLLKNWLEPLPDGSFPNINVREAVLKVLTNFPVGLEKDERREQFKHSGIGRVVMFLSKSDEETASNRKLARDLVDKWSRPLFSISTRFEDMRNNGDVEGRRVPVKKPAKKVGVMESEEGDLDLALDLSKRSLEPKSSKVRPREYVSRPEAVPLDFQIRPQPKIDWIAVAARSAQQAELEKRRESLNKKMKKLKASNKIKLQTVRISVEGRGMVKYV